jgi:hypothetical protein
MNKIAAYKIISPQKLVVEYYAGEITVEDLMHLKETVSKETNYDFYFDTVLDLRDAILKMNKEDLIRLLEFMKERFKDDKTRYVAYLTSKPNDVVQSLVWSQLVKEQSELDMKPQVFSTIDAAADYFDNYQIDNSLISSVLVELKVQPKNIFS